MGIATYDREDGWSFIDDINSPGRGNGRWINNKISYDVFGCGQSDCQSQYRLEWRGYCSAARGSNLFIPDMGECIITAQGKTMA